MTGTERERFLVDGMNVVGSRPDGWWRDRAGAAAALVRELEAWAARTGNHVTVVFDGRGTGAHGPLPVVFAGHADDEIARRVAADPDGTTLTVVTSDAGLAARVRAHGATVTGAGAFRSRIAPSPPAS